MRPQHIKVLKTALTVGNHLQSPLAPKKDCAKIGSLVLLAASSLHSAATDSALERHTLRSDFVHCWCLDKAVSLIHLKAISRAGDAEGTLG